MNQPAHHGWLYRRMVLPLLALLRMGEDPRRLAWSLALGLVIGINPLLGTTTLLCLLLALLFRLHVAASQLANHAMYPVQLLLAIPFLRAGCRVFGTAPMPLSPGRMLNEARISPWALTRQLWLWEWHALAVWAVFAVSAAPILAAVLTPVLRLLMARVKLRQYPIMPAA